MAQRLQDQSDGLPAARRTTVNADVGGGLEKRGLRSGLRRNRGSWRWRHWSRATRRGGRSGMAGPPVASGTGWNSRSPIGLHGRPSQRQDLGVTHESYVPDGGSCRCCRFRAKYFCCASCSSWVSSGSRLLSGRTKTISEFDPTSAFALGSFAATRSRQCALVFSQKIIAVMLPALAAANKKPEIVALASATPRSSSSRKRLRNVFAVQPMILAMSSCGTPRPWIGADSPLEGTGFEPSVPPRTERPWE